MYKEKFIFNSSPLFLLLGGIFAWFIYMKFLGGFAYFFSNLYIRGELTRGTGYFMGFWMNLIQISVIVVFFLLVRTKKTSFFKKTLAILLSTICFFILVSLGGRNPGIMLLWSILLFFNFFNKKINPFNYKIVLLLISLFVFSLFLGEIRSKNYEQTSDFSFNSVISEAFESAGKTFVVYSGGLERKILVTAYVSNKGHWLGSSYKDIFKAPIPRSWYPEKPPVDDGMYIWSIALGRTITPPKKIEELDVSSWPIGNWMGMMNWGLPGLIFFSFLSGLLMNASYYAFQRSEKHLFLFFVYSYCVYRGGIQFDNLGIVSFLTKMLFLHISFQLLILSNLITIPKKSIAYVVQKEKYGKKSYKTA